MSTDSLLSRRLPSRQRAGEVLLRPPPVVGHRARGLALASLLTMGGLVGLSGLAVSSGRGVPTGLMVAQGVGSIVAGVALVRFWTRLPPWGFHSAVALATTSVGVAAWEAGRGTPGLAFATLLFFVALYAGFCFSLLAAFLHGGYGLVLLALVFTLLGQPFGLELMLLAGVWFTIAVVSNAFAHVRSRTEIDPLTAVYNRRGLERVFAEAVQRADATATPLSLAILDLDDFKRHNDVHGHEQGDRTLVASADAWRSVLPGGASLARVGGDEFVVVLPGVEPVEARGVVEALRRSVPRHVRCSAGVAAWYPGDTQSLVLGRADTALYIAKAGGRDRTHVVGEEASRAGELREAIDAGQLRLHFQPVCRLDDGHVVAVEALVRWQHPSEGLLGPPAFLPVAERSGAIHALGRWVLDEACRQLRTWRDALPDSRLLMSVNVATAQLRRERFVDDVEATAAGHLLDPRDLVIEITEGAFEGETHRPLAAIEQLRELGTRLAMDDFGTGHSSLARLQHLPFEILKIDRSFVSALGDGDGGEAVLRAVVALAESFGMRAVAEGIETEAQQVAAGRVGCAWGQGYALGRPMPADRLDALLAEKVLRSPDPSAG